MRRTGVVVALAVLLAGCSAGCTQSQDASATSTSSANAAVDPIPPIRDAKNLASTPPCGLLTSAQLAANQIDLSGRSTKVVAAPACKWENKAHTREIIVWADVSHDVLHNVYADRAMYQVFEVTQVAGQPAVRAKNLVNGTTCYFMVAAAKRQTFTLGFTSLRQGLEEPCGPARALAEAVMGNLPPLRG
jgi:Protein of unknown function (DUF3558)